jgi:hypothetical protein
MAGHLSNEGFDEIGWFRMCLRSYIIVVDVGKVKGIEVAGVQGL